MPRSHLDVINDSSQVMYVQHVHFIARCAWMNPHARRIRSLPSSSDTWSRRAASTRPNAQRSVETSKDSRRIKRMQLLRSLCNSVLSVFCARASAVMTNHTICICRVFSEYNLSNLCGTCISVSHYYHQASLAGLR